MKACLLTVSALCVLAVASAAAAQPAAKPADDMKGKAMPASATKTGKGVGVITEIDAKASTLTNKHQPIAALGWPAMTMSFHAKSPDLLKGLKIGEKIAFDANQGAGLPEVTAIRKR